MTGRIVDSYTNISTVKLFAHADREDGYARDGMEHMLGTVHGSMRATTRHDGRRSICSTRCLLFSAPALVDLAVVR